MSWAPGWLLLFGLGLTTAREDFDVTTLYRIGSNYNNSEDAQVVEVHLRTNARGLPISYGGRIFDDFTTGRYFPSLQSSFTDKKREQSQWETKGWGQKTERGIFGHILESIELNSTLSKIQPLTGSMGVELFGYFRSYSFLDVLILPNETTLIRNLSHYYTIRLRSGYNYNSYLYYCRTNVGSKEYYNDLDGQTLNTNCDGIASISNPDWKYNTDFAENTFFLSFNDGKLRLWTDSEQNSLALDWEPPPYLPPIEAKYLTWYYGDDENLLFASFFPLNEGLFPNRTDSKMFTADPLVSPWFIADMDELCLVIGTKGNGTIELNITAQNKAEDSYFLGKASSSLLSYGWEVLHFTTSLPTELKGEKIRLFLTALCRDTNFTIQIISSCNGEEGDVAALALEEVRALSPQKKMAFGVNMDTCNRDVNWCSKYNKIPNLIRTSNGGCISDFSDLNITTCPPGFTGQGCEEACGSNKFGLDCKGICSTYSYECEGLLLCTPATGCHCAPGFSGETCEERCKPGRYGNDCDQYCGHCKGEYVCDIFTGHCPICEAGYYPPYCKDTYPVVVNRPEITTPSYGQAIVVPVLSNYKGRGIPTMYQIQYRESTPEMNSWTIHSSFSYYLFSTIKQNVTTIKGLSHGKFYEARVILFDDNLNSYQGDDVPSTRFLSLCTIPDTLDYHITAESGTNSLKISWDYKNTSLYWCPVLYYQVFWKPSWKWINKNTTNTSFILNNLLSGKEIKFKIRAYTTAGFAPFSETIIALTKLTVPGKVRYLSSEHRDNYEIIKWLPPVNYETANIDYHVEYKCLRRFACTLRCDPSNNKELQVSNTNITLYSLLPSTQYLITVSALEGPSSLLEIGTKMSAPTEIVKASTKSAIRTNNSITVFWEPVEVCSGFLNGYIYKLYEAKDNNEVRARGFTKENQVTIEGLSAKTDYLAQIFIETVVGWDSDKYLLINISTSATVPDKVENLTVYKRGRNVLGLRWEQPKKLYGDLKSFTISYGYGKGSDNKVESVLPTPCTAWSHLYCYSIENLIPNKKYTVSVAAKNTEVAEDGSPASITGVTKEGMAGVPEDVNIINTTSTGFAVSWKYPSMANGIIRSFVISVEETEQYESDKCCQIYPLNEISVKEELPKYSVEVSGLHPASTYIVSLSAKTVSFGQSITLTIHTRPPPMPIQYLPKITVSTEEAWDWQPQQHLETFNNSDIYHPLIKSNILLVVMNSTSAGYISGIVDEQLTAELKKHISTDFYLAAEYLKVDDIIVIGSGEVVETKWGKLRNPPLEQGQSYRFAAVQISEYCGVYNIDVVFSTMFTTAKHL